MRNLPESRANPAGTARALAERARGAYLGLAVGDALGATVEFLTSGEIRTLYGVHRDIVGGGWLKIKPGHVTDDTQMSLALGEAILESGGWDLKAIADRWAAWLKGKPIDVGNTCRRGLARYVREGTLEGPPNEADAGNGACMRNLPVVLFTVGDDVGLESRTLAQSHVTHNHPLSDAGTVTSAKMTAALLRGEGLDAARRIADALVATHNVFRFDPYPKRSSAFIVDTLQTVFHSFFSSSTFEDCIIKTVNLGGDADTTGAITGMLAGAAYGETAIPERWLRRLDSRVRKSVEEQALRLLELGGAGSQMLQER